MEEILQVPFDPEPFPRRGEASVPGAWCSRFRCSEHQVQPEPRAASPQGHRRTDSKTPQSPHRRVLNSSLTVPVMRGRAASCFTAQSDPFLLGPHGDHAAAGLSDEHGAVERPLTCGKETARNNPGQWKDGKKLRSSPGWCGSVD